MKILVAEDDNMMNRLTVTLLEKWGHEVISVSNGREALEILKNPGDSPPGIALVDWVMPELDGIELCEKIKKEGQIPYFIYFIILTGRKTEDDIVTGLDAGADDYIFKPIKRDELKSRLEVGIRTVKYERQLQESNMALAKYARVMESLADEKARQLVHVERLAMLGELSAGLAHEINNYIAPVRGYMDLICLQLDSMSSIQEKEKNDLLQSVEKAKIAASKIGDLVNRMRIHSRKGSVEKSKENIHKVIEKAAELCANRLKYFDYSTVFDEKIPELFINSQELEQVFVNLLKNAVDVLGGRKGTIKVSTFLAAGNVALRFEDSGPGISADMREKIFEAFYSTKSPEVGTGLGLSVSKSIVESHGGKMHIEDSELGGAAFVIELPAPIE